MHQLTLAGLARMAAIRALARGKQNITGKVHCCLLCNKSDLLYLFVLFIEKKNLNG